MAYSGGFAFKGGGWMGNVIAELENRIAQKLSCLFQTEGDYKVGLKELAEIQKDIERLQQEIKEFELAIERLRGFKDE